MATQKYTDRLGVLDTREAALEDSLQRLANGATSITINGRTRVLPSAGSIRVELNNVRAEKARILAYLAGEPNDPMPSIVLKRS